MTGKVRYRGRLVRGDGRPVSGALVTIAQGTAPTPEIAQRTGDDGEFALQLPPGTFELAIHTPEGANTRVRLDTTSLDTEFSITLPPDIGTKE